MFVTPHAPRRSPRRTAQPWLASDARAAYGDPVERLAAAVSAVVASPIDGLSDDAVERRLSAVRAAERRLEAHRTLVVAELRRRATARARAEAKTNPNAEARRAEAELTHQLRDKHRLTPSEAKRTIEAGRLLQSAPELEAAAMAGKLSSDHARQLGRVLDHLTGDEQDLARRELLPRAATEDAVTFGRSCRRWLAAHDTVAAQRDLDRQRACRYGRMGPDADGMLHLSAGFVGADAELVATAIETFRRADGDDERRTRSRQTADAIVAAFRAALDHGVTTTDHGSRPHVLVTTTRAALATRRGLAETCWTGPLPVTEITRLADDAVITSVTLDPDGQPVETGRRSRTVDARTWNALVARDRHCVWPGCTAPPALCQAMHVGRRWKDGAGSTVGELALGCGRHHVHIDRHRLVGRRHPDGTWTWHPPPPDDTG